MMALSRQQQGRKREQEMDARPDAWERFEHAVDAAVKAGPKHRKAEKGKKPARRDAE